MDVVILNTDEGWPDTLRYCIRSIEQYMDYDNLWVVGHLPEYLNCNCIHNDDDHFIPQVNATRKLHEVSQAENVSDEFVLFHDDFFLLSDYEPIQYYSGYLQEKFNRIGNTRRKDAMRITLKYVPEGLNYELHYPFPMRKQDLQTMLADYRWQHGIVYYSLYGNLFNHFEKQEQADCKFRPRHDQKAILEQVQDWYSFSTHPVHENEKYRDLFETLYPKASIYEK